MSLVTAHRRASLVGLALLAVVASLAHHGPGYPVAEFVLFSLAVVATLVTMSTGGYLAAGRGR